ncbi:uncharacterized protein LOC143256756 [Tachypleus tridentatus]|uniref:uncharacterized protein LOC143256756 n=1 Tax=Tachypleus tridentatus TaxID=6853 RepID=UPI003FD480D2
MNLIQIFAFLLGMLYLVETKVSRDEPVYSENIIYRYLLPTDDKLRYKSDVKPLKQVDARKELKKKEALFNNILMKKDLVEDKRPPAKESYNNPYVTYDFSIVNPYGYHTLHSIPQSYPNQNIPSYLDYGPFYPPYSPYSYRRPNTEIYPYRWYSGENDQHYKAHKTIENKESLPFQNGYYSSHDGHYVPYFTPSSFSYPNLPSFYRYQ